MLTDSTLSETRLTVSDVASFALTESEFFVYGEKTDRNGAYTERSLSAYDYNGEELWSVNLSTEEEDARAPAGLSGISAIDQNSIYLGLVAYNRANGEKRWGYQVEESPGVRHDPVPVNDQLYVISEGKVKALE